MELNKVASGKFDTKQVSFGNLVPDDVNDSGILYLSDQGNVYVEEGKCRMCAQNNIILHFDSNYWGRQEICCLNCFNTMCKAKLNVI